MSDDGLLGFNIIAVCTYCNKRMKHKRDNDPNVPFSKEKPTMTIRTPCPDCEASKKNIRWKNKDKK